MAASSVPWTWRTRPIGRSSTGCPFHPGRRFVVSIGIITEQRAPSNHTYAVKRWISLPETHPHHDYYANAHGYSMDENHSNWQSLVGFGYERKPEAGSWKRLSTLLHPSMFPYHLGLWVKTAGAEEGRAALQAKKKGSFFPLVIVSV